MMPAPASEMQVGMNIADFATLSLRMPSANRATVMAKITTATVPMITQVRLLSTTRRASLSVKISRNCLSPTNFGCSGASLRNDV